MPSRDIDNQRIAQSDWMKVYFSLQLEIMCIKVRKTGFVQNQLIFHFDLFYLWPYFPDQPKTYMACLASLLATPNQEYDFQTFPSLVIISMQKI